MTDTRESYYHDVSDLRDENAKLRAELDALRAAPSALMEAAKNALALCKEMYEHAEEWSGARASSHYRSDICHRMDAIAESLAAAPEAKEPSGKFARILPATRSEMPPMEPAAALDDTRRSGRAEPRRETLEQEIARLYGHEGRP